ncbi:MAG: transcription-repair coupling factor [Alphaproteobacteria bacterium]|nr:transcription-repair coupling factor [Alphaproteobacteria bacterium]
MQGYLDSASELEGVGWAGLPLDAVGFLVSRLDPDGRWLVVVDEPDRADQLTRAARFFHPRPEVVERFYADDGRPYDGFSPERTRAQNRIRALRRVQVGGPVVVVASARALLQRVPTAEVLAKGTRTVQTGDTLDRDDLVRWLTDAGYLSTQTAEMVGSFAVRGDVLDVWPSASTAPVRIDFFDDEIEGIRALDPESGRPSGARKRVALLPAREERVDAEALERLQDELGRQVTAQQRGIRLKRRVVEELRSGIRFSALEDWLPALVPTEGPLEAFAALRTVVYEPADVLAAGRELLRTARQRWEALEDEERPLVPPSERFDTLDSLQARVEASQKVWQIAADGAARFEVATTDGFGARGTDLAPVAGKLLKLMDRDCRVALVADTPARGDALEELLGPHGIQTSGATEALGIERGRISLLVGDLPRGFVAPQSGWAFVPAHVLLGGAGRAKRTRLERIHALFETEVTDIAQLKVDDYVVHRLHGVGVYRGMKRVPIMGVAQDFVRLEYRGGDTMFLPVTRLGQLSRYTPANSNAAVKLDRLGGATWLRRKGKVRDALLKMAQDLLRLYARRELATRTPYPHPGPLYRQLESRFPYDETVDQLKAIEAVNHDLDRPFPMDRLLCGDVGFGKTEVAIRAAARVVEGRKQVAILCPTTVLAYQHYNTWRERFEGLPVRIRMLSRFNSAEAEQEAIAGLRDGTVDIVVGTTKLLGRDVKFDRLGMVVVDEEHRFGVRQKDQLKKLRAAVDVLSMSATPIPRTLQQALGGLREMSVMATPPADRLSVATSLARLSESRVRDALITEIERGGQAFVIHNRVETIQRFRSQLEAWVPEARFDVAHGQMDDEQLEDVLVRFINRDIDVLVCTAIVETGVDLPNVNTMLIHRADLFGLAQLYQLRGRVGRSHVRARCLLLTPEDMTAEARKRLRVLVENTELGAGFQVASADLELRGGGNLLGAAQSGNIDQVGYEVWVELLEEAVHVARGEAALEQIEPEIEVGVDAFIPDALIADMRERLAWYARLSNATSVGSVEQHLDDLELLVGDLPIEVRNLAGLLQARLRCVDLGIQRCSWLKVRVELELHPSSPLGPDALNRVIAKHPKRFRVREGTPTKVDVRFTPSEAEQPFRYLLWVFGQLDRASRG